MVKLGEVCEIFGRIGFRGYTTKDIVQSPKDGAISLSPSNIQNGKMDYSKCTYISWYKYNESPEIMISNGDILLVKTGSSYGKSALVEHLPHEATINPQSVVLKNFKIYNKFLAYQIRTKRIKDEFDKFVSGTAIPTFSQAKLSEVLICLPPLEEQHRIVSILDASFEKIDALKKNAEDNLKNAKALFQQVLTQELKPKDGWVEKKLGEVATFSQGVQVPLPEQSLIEQEGYSRFLRIIDYTQGNEPPRYTLINDSKYKMFKDDIAIVRYGASTGFICMGIEGILANNLFKININDYHFIYTYYLSYVLKSEIFQGKIKEQMNGAAMPAISFGMIKNILLPFPINIEEQHRIVRTLDTLSEKCRRLEQVAQQTIRECDALKQSILRQAFSGEL